MLNNFLNLFSDYEGFVILMIGLVLFIGLCVCSFASRYMKGDAKYHYFFIQLALLIFAVSIMIVANNLILFFIAWCMSNALLVSLMIHKSSWKAAKASGMLAAKNYFLGACCIGSAFTIFYLVTGEISINTIIHQNADSNLMLLALVLMLIGAMTQSAIWPFHRWLVSSLNSPTPVSAIMHAGLVNGGGFLLVRFAHLYLQHSRLLTVIFVIGLLTALLGTLWKLMQSDVKRMLACSTMGQMGFMLLQCGLGLFPAAVAHLVWHGMFKAYLFLGSGSAAQEKRFDLHYPPKLSVFICALFCGFFGSLAFAYVTSKSWLAGDTTLVLTFIAFLTSSQLALPMLQVKPFQKLPLVLMATTIIGFCYGFSVQLIAWVMEPMSITKPQTLNAVHIIGIIILTLAWFSMLFFKHKTKAIRLPAWMLRAYVAALNASQPCPKTVTSHRNQYQY